MAGGTIWQNQLFLPMFSATKETEFLGNNKFSVKYPPKKKKKKNACE